MQHGGMIPGQAPEAGEGVSMQDVYQRLRCEILSGEFAPTAAFSQVKLAERLGVSRTPLREALRLLEREGLIETTPNRKAKVVQISPADLDDLCGTRIMLEALAVSISIARATPEDFQRLQELLDEMDVIAQTRDILAWEVPHARFHETLIRHAGGRMFAMACDLRDHSQRYRSLVLNEPLAWTKGADEHNEICRAYVARDQALAADRLATHYARTALTLITRMAPEYDPVSIRQALRFAQVRA
jgi:DNA-binding GntR family transcriptional regulator